MIYGYSCTSCGFEFDVVKPIAEYQSEERCEKCQSVAARHPFPRRLHLVGTKVQEAEYNPGLGCIVKNKAHREEICRSRGLEEIGNEKPDSIHKHFEKVREDKWERGWEQTTKEWVGDGS